MVRGPAVPPSLAAWPVLRIAPVAAAVTARSRRLRPGLLGLCRFGGGGSSGGSGV